MATPTPTNSMRKTTATDRPTAGYRGPAAAGAPNLAGVEGVRSTVSGGPVVLEFERYDSPDLRLATSGIVLAVHRTDDPAHPEAFWRLDLPDAVEGEQLRIPVTPPDVEGVDPEVPAELRELVQGVLRGADVAPVGRIRRVRTVDSLRDGRRREIAEIRRDEVQLATFGEATTLENWTEDAVTISGGPAGLLDVLAERLAATGAVPADATAEAELDRLLREAAPPPPARWQGRKGASGTAVLGYLAEHADRLAAEDLRARRDEEDAVHQLRVAARRMRSALQAFAPVFEGPRPEALIEELRWLGRALAPARDSEVQEEQITAAVRALPPELVLGPVQAQITRHFARSRAEARAAAIAALDGERYAALRGAIEHFLQDPPLARGAGSKKAGRKALSAALKKADKRFDKRVAAALDALASGGASDTAIHDARKAGKRLRYATELAGTPKQARKLKTITKALGEHQDVVVGRQLLRELGAQASAEGENGFTFGILYGRAQAAAERIEEQLPELRRH
ncbi:CHAD domain-containing protein [Pseudonocardia kujensis]|uniref:CYTH and CHAD domain-containing protein n=1 Tax=Pseudonocardia kujensis TaxID=1128675 RepID=UPI001E5B6339|nr:CHAD domain-containing protein [Pseudonocardia kujensis]MCE0763404.1 CHAD domain-containing protein [Pseudonocardia kujensis]